MLLSHANMLFKRAWMMFKFTVRQVHANILSCKYAKHAKNVESIQKNEKTKKTKKKQTNMQNTKNMWSM